MTSQDAIFRQLVQYRRAYGGVRPNTTAMTPTMHEQFVRERELARKYPTDPLITDRVWGMSVVVDPSLPAEPGFEVRIAPA